MQETTSQEGRQADKSPGQLVARSSVYQITILVALSVGMRIIALANVDTLILSWRPTEMATIALNYFRHGFHFFSPQVNWGGNGLGYVEMEFPAIPYITAVLYKMFGVHEWLALLIPIFSGLGLVIVVYYFTRLVFGSAVAFTSAIFMALSPTMFVLTIGLWPDPPMIFFGALGLYALTHWAMTDSQKGFLVGAFGVALAILLKLTALYLGFPILYLCISKFGSNWWKKPQVWVLASLILLPAILWYWHAHNLFEATGNTFGILSAGYMKFGTTKILTSPDFYASAISKMCVYHFTPVVFGALIYGLFVREQRGVSSVFRVWFAASAVSLLVAARGVTMGHYQYMLPVVPSGAVLAGLGAMDLIRRTESYTPIKRFAKSRWLIFSAGGTFIVLSVVGSALFWLSRDHLELRGWENDRETGLAVRAVTDPASLIVVVDGQMDGIPPERIMTPPNVFYFSDRHGWYCASSWLTVDRVEGYRREGGRYMIITGNFRSSFETSQTQVKECLSARYSTVLDDNRGIVYDLETQRARTAVSKPRTD